MSDGAKRFLLATWEGGGNLTPEMGIAKRLLARGHSVHVLADSAAEAAARGTGCTFSSWQRAPNKKSLAPEDDLMRDWEFKNPLKLFQHALDVFFAGPQGRYAADVLEIVDRERPDCILADFAMLGAIMAAEARKLPCAVIIPNIYMRSAPGIPPLGPGWMPARGPLGKMRDGIMRALSERIWKKGLPPINAARADLGLAPLSSFWSQYDRADAAFVLTSRAFDFEAERLPENVRYLGPVLDDPAWAAQWTPPWPEGSPEPVVLVALSSTYQNQLAVLSNVVQALSGLPVRALVTLGPALAPDAIRSTSPNVVVVRTAPHGAVIPRASLVVTHCGHGTTIKALAAGVPLLCMPMGRDQNDTAARVVARGAGLRIKPTSSPETIRAALARLIAEPGFREAAGRLAGAMASEAAQVDLVGEIESVARSRAPAVSGAGSTVAGPSLHAAGA